MVLEKGWCRNCYGKVNKQWLMVVEEAGYSDGDVGVSVVNGGGGERKRS
jgi:hypothetical protein